MTIFEKLPVKKKSGRDNFRPKKVPVTFFGVAVTNFQNCARDTENVAVTIFGKVPVTFLEVPVTLFRKIIFFPFELEIISFYSVFVVKITL